MGRQGLNDLQIVGLFSTETVQTGSKAYPTSYSLANGGLSTRVNEPWRETDQSLPSSIEVKQEWFHSATLSCFGVVRKEGCSFTLYSYDFTLPPPEGTGIT